MAPRGSPSHSSRSRPRSRSPSRRDRDRESYPPRRRSPPQSGRGRDNGYGSRGGYNDEGGSSRGGGYGGNRGGRDGGYTERDRERERDGERKRYEADSRGDGPRRVTNGEDEDADRPPSVEPEKPNFGTSGLLAKETNTVQGVLLKYNEPPEARKPLKNWRLYVFKGKEQVDLIHIYRQSAYLVGRDTVVTDIPIAHPSCSKQHAAIQFRQISEKSEYGEVTTSVKPFIIDLDSTNGTHVNDQEIPKSRYYELRNSDVIKFGTSSREYVLLHEEAST